MEKVKRTWGYSRVSTNKQSKKRQIDNIKSAFPDAVIVEETYTGTTLKRPQWQRLMKQVKPGDTIVFDEVSRMSRDAEEGYKVYRELYEKGVKLVFLKESTLNTENFAQAAEQIKLTGTEVDCILRGVNEYLMILAEKQIQAAFATAQHEVEFLRQRTREGVAQAILRGEQVGIEKGRKLTTKKSVACKEIIRKYSKDFSGTLADAEVMKLCDNIARNSYYKYKRELREDLASLPTEE